MFLKWQDTHSRTLWEETKWLLLWSPGTGLFKLVELYLGDGLEMARHLGDFTVTVDSYHGLEMYVEVCNLTNYLYII